MKPPCEVGLNVWVFLTQLASQGNQSSGKIYPYSWPPPTWLCHSVSLAHTPAPLRLFSSGSGSMVASRQPACWIFSLICLWRMVCNVTSSNCYPTFSCHLLYCPNSVCLFGSRFAMQEHQTHSNYVPVTWICHYALESHLRNSDRLKTPHAWRPQIKAPCDVA